MSRFQDGTWSFHAKVDPSPKQWEVTYLYRIGNREARALFHTEEEAQKFADVNGGKVKHLVHRGGFR